MSYVVNSRPVVHVVSVGSTLTALAVALKRRDLDGTESAVDLTGKTVKVKLVDSAGEDVVSETETGVTVTAAASGEVQYDLPAEAVASARDLYGYFYVYSGDEFERFPPDARRLVISVQGDV